MTAGKFLADGNRKTYIRGVTYGPFNPTETGNEYRNPSVVDRDFARMAAHNVNAVRTYTVPPRWLLDRAADHGLKVFIGVPWEQHVTFLDERQSMRRIEQSVRMAARSCAGHPAVLAYAIGNEIPAPIVRWHGRKRIERFIKRLFEAAKEEDPQTLVTYVNYPTTEYLQLPFLDFVSFNVYLESPRILKQYLARLQNLSGDLPLVIGELGLDSRRNGAARQAESLDWQVRTVFEAGCAGAFVFAWTDEWHRGGYDVTDWDFGLTDRHRLSKPALGAVSRAFAEVPFPHGLNWPRISVVVCVYNGEKTIRYCLEGVLQLDYPNYEIIVVDDGSTDATGIITTEYGVRLIQTKNGGLSRARNTGLEAATGEIVAYIDSDSSPDPHWLQYLAHAFSETEHVAIGGPNIHPPSEGEVAECVANAPGGPAHVLLTDEEAEHIPGCNMAFRTSALREVGGFDPHFRIAGDDVDLCWRLRERGWTLGFHAGAMVWHCRRGSVRAFWKQQREYGKAEAMLARKWPQKYNRLGHAEWRGRIYGTGSAGGFRRWLVYHGVWGSALFQSIYAPRDEGWRLLLLIPECLLVIAASVLLSLIGVFWKPLIFTLPLGLLLSGAILAHALSISACARFRNAIRAPICVLLKLRLLTAWLHVMQPAARLWGRLSYDLAPWTKRGIRGRWLWRAEISHWSEEWKSVGELADLIGVKTSFASRRGSTRRPI